MSHDKNDLFGNRMKYYESLTETRLKDGFPIVARLDGKGFSKFTKGLIRPVDLRLRSIFDEVCITLIEKTSADVAYHQSDEITLIWKNEKPGWYNGRLLKMTSVLSSITTAKFNRLTHNIGKQDVDAIFDCRVFQVPSIIEAMNSVLWREFDCEKNSISMAARTKFSAEEVFNKNGLEMKQMLLEVGIDWSDYPICFKYGTYFTRVKKIGKIDPEELENLPLLHNARKNPDLIFERSVITKKTFENLQDQQNKIAALFE